MDRDSDGYLDQDEVDAGSNPSNALSVPGPVGFRIEKISHTNNEVELQWAAGVGKSYRVVFADFLPEDNGQVPPGEIQVSNGRATKSLSENSKWPCFHGKGRMAKRDEGAYPPAACDRGATKPVSPFRENPPGDGPFGLGLHWLGRYSPLRGCAGLAALAQAKIPRRNASSNFQTGSKTDSVPAQGPARYYRIEVLP